MTRMDDNGEFRAELSPINPQLAVIISKMVEIKPDERYTDDRELLSALEKVRLTAKKSRFVLIIDFCKSILEPV